jgi:hypothetical protein
MSKKTKSQYLYIFRNPGGQPDVSPKEMEAIYAKWFAWIGAMDKKGQYASGDPLDDTGKVLRGPGGKKVHDGPFAEAKEIVAGYMVINAPSLAAAAKLARGCPIYEVGGSVEVRRIEHIEM